MARGRVVQFVKARKEKAMIKSRGVTTAIVMAFELSASLAMAAARTNAKNARRLLPFLIFKALSDLIFACLRLSQSKSYTEGGFLSRIGFAGGVLRGFAKGFLALFPPHF